MHTRLAFDRALTLHPGVSVWPANLLRFHIEFQQPAPVNDVLRNLRLLRSDGFDARGAIVDLDYGLWSADDRWLTVIFHPGRVKSGLQAHEQLGPALIEGVSYSIQINLPEYSTPMSFTVGPTEDRPIDPQVWRCRKPNPEELILYLNRAVDTLSAFSHLRLVDRNERALAAPHAIDGHSIRFPLPAEATALRIDSRFEDPCGNRCARSFEARAQDDGWSPEPVILPLASMRLD